MNENDERLPASKFKAFCLLMAALIASFGSVMFIERSGILRELPSEFAELPMSPSKEYMARYRMAFRELLTGNYAIHFGALGALLGLAIGMVGTSKNQTASIGSAIFGGFVGGAMFATLGGFVLGWITTLGLEVNWETIRFIGFHVDPFVQSTLLQCAIWSVMGIGIGIGCTLSSFSIQRVFRGVRGGLFGGVLAGILHSISAAIFFSGSSAFDFVPVNFSERIVWALTCGICICIGLLYSLAKRCGQTITASDSTDKPSQTSSFVGA